MRTNTKDKVNINLALSKSLLDQIRREAQAQEISYSALIRLILQAYFNDKYGTKNKDGKNLGNL